MRIWSIHPSYLDRMGLLAAWREGLLAQAVLAGQTKGYKNHPQLERFKKTTHPLEAIAGYLKSIACIAKGRGYNFDSSKIIANSILYRGVYIPVTRDQIEYELNHLKKKLKERSPETLKKSIWEIHNKDNTVSNWIFNVIPGPIESWEKV